MGTPHSQVFGDIGALVPGLAEGPVATDPGRMLHACLERAPLPSAVVSGAAHHLVFANAAFRQLSERSGGRAEPGAPLDDALPSAEHQGLVALLDRVRRDGAPLHDAHPGPPPDARPPGDRATWCCDVWPILEEWGTVDRLVVAVRATRRREDTRSRQRTITERLLLTALREQDRAHGADTARRDAEHANQVKTSFLTSMSHELRTPLNAILGYAELVAMGLRGPVTPEQVEALTRIRRAGQHLLGLINNVLNFARLKALQLRFALADGPAVDLLDSAALMVEPQALGKGIVFVRRPCPPALTVHGDHEKVLQILLNLLSNAIKFTEPGGHITLGAAELDRRRRVMDVWSGPGSTAGAAVEFTVVDTGRGMTAEQRATVFEPFVQVGRRLSGVDEGTGLGLAISRDLARGMSGDLTVASEPGGGSTFTLTIPSVPPA